MCSNTKRHFRDEGPALAAMHRMILNPQNRRHHNPCRVIPCDRHCGEYVLTSSPQRATSGRGRTNGGKGSRRSGRR